MPEAIISAKGTEAPTVRSGRFTYEVNGQAGEAAPFPSMIVVMRTGER